MVEKCKTLDKGCGLNSATAEYGDMIPWALLTHRGRSHIVAVRRFLACLILVTEATINEKVEEVTWEDLGIKVGE
ncbi:MAG: hypothetical protein ACLT98_02350 [Eggerthellaceae bacterium]